MKKVVSVLVLIILCFSFSSFKKTATKTGVVHKIVIEVDESLMERLLVKDKNGDINYNRKGQISFADELDFEYFSMDKVTSIMKDFAEIIGTSIGYQSLTMEGRSKANVNNMLGNLVSNVQGRTTMQFFPNKSLKKSKKKNEADEYLTFKMNFISPNQSTMNKNYEGNRLSFKVNINIISTNNKGDILWEKEKEIKDFSSVFENSSITNVSEAEFFTVSREPRLFHRSSNKPIGDFNSLSLDEIESCMKFALNYIVSN